MVGVFGIFASFGHMFHILQDSREQFTSRPVDSEREESSVQIDVAAKVTNYIPGLLSRRVSHVESHVREVELLEKTATRADLADATPVPCAHVGIRDGVASSEELGCPGRRPSAL